MCHPVYTSVHDIWMCFDSSAQLEHSALNLCLPDPAIKMREGASSCKRDRITACLSGHRTRSALPSLIFPSFSVKHFWLFECALVQSGSMRRTKKYFGLLVFGFGYRVLIILFEYLCVMTQIVCMYSQVFGSSNYY